LIARWKTGFWVRQPEDLGPLVERLLRQPDELRTLQENCRALARPHAAREAAQAILERWRVAG
jgi:UDP-N-acetylglucosamine:LPS N-acetylglucosamine transferase